MFEKFKLRSSRRVSLDWGGALLLNTYAGVLITIGEMKEVKFVFALSAQLDVRGDVIVPEIGQFPTVFSMKKSLHSWNSLLHYTHVEAVVLIVLAGL